MKKLFLPLVLTAMTAATPIAAQQQKSSVDEQTQRAYNSLISQYATSSLGFYIEQRCRQLAEDAYIDFARTQQLLNSFMVVMMGLQANTKLLTDIQTTAANAETNPCDVDTFRFALNSSRISSNLATRVQLLTDEELAAFEQALTTAQPTQQTQAQPQSETQPTVQPQQTTPTPQPVEQPVEEPQSTEPKETFGTIPTTQVMREPEAERTNNQQTTNPAQQTPPPVNRPETSSTTTQTAAVGIALADYVNPFPYSPGVAPANETEKDMKRRHRQEIIDLRRAQRAELDAFKDAKDSYADPDAVEDYIKDRQDDEFDAMRNRHQQELGRY